MVPAVASVMIVVVVMVVVVLDQLMVVVMVFLHVDHLRLRGGIVHGGRGLVRELVRQLLVLVGAVVGLTCVGHVTRISVHLL